MKIKTRARWLPLALLTGLFMVIAANQAAAPVAATADIFYVAPNGECGTLVITCFDDLQEAVDAAPPGGEIRIATGTYTQTHDYNGLTQILLLNKTVTIRGGYSTNDWEVADPVANPTILDAQERGRVIYVTGSVRPVIQGLHITGGHVGRLDPNDIHSGGGVYIFTAPAVFSHNWIYGNTADQGGGMYLLNSKATISETLVTSNTAGFFGGGAHLAHSNVQLSRSLFRANESLNGSGGGMGLLNSVAVLNANRFINNDANHYGGGLALYNNSDARLTNNLIVDNHAGGRGSGIHVMGASPTLLQNTIAFNNGGNGSGVYVEEQVDGVDVFYSTVRFSNTIISHHHLGLYVDPDNTATLQNTLWYSNTGNWGGGGTITHTADVTGTPAFLDPGSQDYHLDAASAARDAGTDTGVATDLDGQARPDPGGYDIGADEFYRPSCTFLPNMCAFHGDLHSHTGYSDGPDGTRPEDAYAAARSHGMDFFATTDHGFLLSDQEWNNTLAQAQAATVDGVFLALRGFEWTSDEGHLNVFGSDHFVSAHSSRYNKLDEFYAWLAEPGQSNAIAQFNHPNAPDGAFHDLAYDLVADARVNLIELGNSYFTYPDEYLTALSKGWHVAPTNNSDDHLGKWGQRRAHVGVVAPALNRDQVLDALRARRTFASEDENLVLALQADGQWMGAIIPAGRTYFKIYVLDPNPRDFITTLELYKNGELFASKTVESAQFTWKFELDEPLLEENWWYAKAIQQDGDEAQTSSIWTFPPARTCWVRLNDEPTDYDTVQEAVDASTHPDDVIKVAGRCSGVHTRANLTQTLYISKPLTVRGGYTLTNWNAANPITYPTVLDAQGKGRVVYITGDISPTLIPPTTIEGLHITGGYVATAQGGTLKLNYGGGGVYVESVPTVLRDNHIYDNVAEYGGGVHIVNSAATLAGNVLLRNTATVLGGGISLYQGSDARLVNNVIARNRAGEAGSGLSILGASPILLHNTIVDNDGGQGSGVHVSETFDWSLGETISSTARLTNTILSGHPVGVHVNPGNSALLDHTLWHNNGSDVGDGEQVQRLGDVFGDPVFVDPADGDYHISTASAARDKAVGAGVIVDIDGEARPNAAGYDIGADEFWLAVLEISQRVSADPVKAGSRLTYTVHLTNVGVIDLHATLTDTLPSGILTDESLAGTVLLPGDQLAWRPVITAPGGAWAQQIAITVPLSYVSGSLNAPLTNVARVTSLEGVTAMSTRTTKVTWPHNLNLPLAMRNYVPPTNVLLNPGFEGIGVPVDNDEPNPGNWTRETFNGIEYNEIATPEGWVTWWEEGEHRRIEAKVIPKEIPYTFDPQRIYQGYYAAMYYTMFSTHNAGYYQKVTGLPPGAPATFFAHAHGWSCTGDDPLGYSCEDLNNMGFRVGIDPNGGTDPWSPDIIWSQRTPSPDIYRKIGPISALVGEAGEVTVFLRSDVLWPFKHNDAYWDNAALMVPIP